MKREMWDFFKSFFWVVVVVIGVVLKQGDLQFGGEVTIYDFRDYY